MRLFLATLFALLLLPLAAAAQDGAWTALYNGENLNGWTHVGDGELLIEDGLLKTEGGMGLLWYTEQTIRNAQIRVEYMSPEGDNAGVFIRIPERPTEPWMPVNRGYEVQINPSGDAYHRTGVLYSLTEAKAEAGQPGAWNTMTITLDGDRTMVHVNGVLVTNYTEGEPVPEKQESYEPDRGPRPTEGYIGLQNHGGEDVVYFRSVKMRPLNN